MKKLLVILFLLMLGGRAWAVTTYTATVMPSSGDYTTLSAAVTALASNLTNDVVMSTTGGITGTMTDNTACTGATSGATGTCVHATATQILIKTVTGIFQSGEIVYETLGVNYVTTSSSPDSVQLNINITGTWASADTTKVNITGYTTDSTHGINIYTSGSARNNTGVWSTSYYRLELASSNDKLITLATNQNYIVIDGLQVNDTTVNDTSNQLDGAIGNSTLLVFRLTIKNCILRGGRYTIRLEGNGSLFSIYNNVIYGSGGGGIFTANGNGTTYLYCYNNTVYNSKRGISANTSVIFAKNNICYSNSTADYLLGGGAFDTSSTNNLSKDATAPAYNIYYTNATVTFNNTAGSDFSLSSSDTGATGQGANLSSDANISFTTDITGATRTVPWDIGAFKSTATAVNHGFTHFLN